MKRTRRNDGVVKTPVELRNEMRLIMSRTREFFRGLEGDIKSLHCSGRSRERFATVAQARQARRKVSLAKRRFTLARNKLQDCLESLTVPARRR